MWTKSNQGFQQNEIVGILQDNLFSLRDKTEY